MTFLAASELGTKKVGIAICASVRMVQFASYFSPKVQFDVYGCVHLC